MEKKEKIIIGVLLIALVLIVGGLYLYDRERQVAPSTKKVEDLVVQINTDDDDEKIDWSKYPTFSYDLEESLVLMEEGVYHLTGELDEGSITVNTNGNIKLILDDVVVNNPDGPALYVENASDVVVETAKDSTNTFSDSATYLHDNTTVIGAIFSHDDITFQGEGTLVVEGKKEDAIVSKDDLKFVSGTYEIHAEDDGIRGKDSVYIQNGTFQIDALGDGIKTTNQTDAGKGFIYIQNGTFNITSTLDAMQAEKILQIDNGVFKLETGGGNEVTSSSDTWGSWGTQKSNSAKGLKANDNLIIQGGTFEIHSSDDAIHSNRYVGIENGTLEILSGDDGLHADEELVIENGTVNIAKSYEGLEASKITVHGGTIHVTSSDDGINIAGGNDKSAMNRRGANQISDNQSHLLTITGGELLIDALGDGIDVNGNCYLKGGTVQVNGPSNDGNGALDYDGKFEVTDGTLLAGGAAGMMLGVSDTSTIYSLSIIFDEKYGNEDKITLLDDNGKEIFSYQSTKEYDSLVVATPKLKKDKTYILQVNGEVKDKIEIKSLITEIGERKNNGRGQPVPQNASGRR